MIRGIFPRRTAPQLRFVLLHDHEVRPKLGGHPGQFLDVGIFAVAGVAEQQPEAAAAAAQMIGHLEKIAQAIGIVGVVDQHLTPPASNRIIRPGLSLGLEPNRANTPAIVAAGMPRAAAASAAPARLATL